MATLRELKPAIDDGKHVRLALLSQKSISIVVYVKRIAEGYAWTLEKRSPSPMDSSVKTESSSYEFPDWDTLVKRIEGVQTFSKDWLVCDK